MRVSSSNRIRTDIIPNIFFPLRNEIIIPAKGYTTAISITIQNMIRLFIFRKLES